MPKGYMIVRMTVTDPETDRRYAELASVAVQRYGATFLVRGGRQEAVEGEARPRNVVLEFESFEAAQTYYHSPEYQAAVAVRKPAGIGEVVLVEGVGGLNLDCERLSVGTHAEYGRVDPLGVCQI